MRITPSNGRGVISYRGENATPQEPGPWREGERERKTGWVNVDGSIGNCRSGFLAIGNIVDTPDPFPKLIGLLQWIKELGPSPFGVEIGIVCGRVAS